MGSSRAARSLRPAGVMAAWAAIDRILVPSVRWAMRRRANRAIDELNTRLKLRIQPFKLTKRQVLIDRLVFDPEVLHAADEYARESGVPREVAMEKVKRYAVFIISTTQGLLLLPQSPPPVCPVLAPPGPPAWSGKRAGPSCRIWRAKSTGRDKASSPPNSAVWW
mgnify:CR=1 FL=1